MAQQEDGWPLGLQPLNARVGLVRSREFSGSTSFNTFISGSPASSAISSSDLDTESTGSFFPDKSTTLGNLIGVNVIRDPSEITVRARRPEPSDCKKNFKSKKWFTLCTKACDYGNSPNNSSSLGHFLEVERRAAILQRRNQNPVGHEFGEFPEVWFSPKQRNSLFADGRIAPPQAAIDGTMKHNKCYGSDFERRGDGDPNLANGVLFSCVCWQPAN